jgi:hypothetical protein
VTVEQLALLAAGIADGSLVVAIDGRRVGASEVAFTAHVFDDTPESAVTRLRATPDDVDHLLAAAWSRSSSSSPTD